METNSQLIKEILSKPPELRKVNDLKILAPLI